MQPLGSAALIAAYVDRITGDHDYDLFVDILDMEENVVGAGQINTDGQAQVNLLPDADVRRTAQLSLLDPDRSLNLDAGTVFQNALFADRMLRIRHVVAVPGFGDVTAVPFVGPITRLNRNGATIDLECQDKTGLAVLGTKPYTVLKGMNAVEAIRQIAYNTLGERKFRLPQGTRSVLTRHHSVGWPDEASPWVIMTRIAASIGMQVFYSCDGYLTVRPKPTSALFGFTEANMTSAVAGDHDFAGVINHARATAGDKIVRTATAPADHPLHPTRLGRNGVARFLPSLADVDAPPDRPDKPGSKHRKASKAQLKKYAHDLEEWRDQVTSATAKAQATAVSLLNSGLPMTAAMSFSAVPVFHLDIDDPVRISTDEGSAVLPFGEATIPLISGDMTVGVRRRGRPSRIRR